METQRGGDGLRIIGAGGRVELGACRPAVSFRIGGRVERWAPAAMAVRAAPAELRSEGGPSGLVLTMIAEPVDAASDALDVTVHVTNSGGSPAHLERLSVLLTDEVRIGERPDRWRTYRNGYQSWSGTRTMGTTERDADVPVRAVRLGVTDARHPSPTGRGHVRSDALTAIAEPVSGDAAAIGFLELADAFAFVELVAPDGVVERLEAWCDLDGVPLAPGASFSSRVRVCISTGPDAGTTALHAVAAATGSAMDARDPGRSHPAGWCSWYYYFTSVSEADVVANLDVLERDGRHGPTFGCDYVMVDDGHQSEVGDWLETDRKRFPSGMTRLADRIRDAGFDAGLWWAPFLVHPRSRIARERPGWLVRTARGRPIIGCLNPNWSVTRPMWVLDTTHPAVLAHLERVASVIGREWGFQVQKLDFLYAAALPGVRHDPFVTRARSLRSGLEAIRRGAGEDGFLLGCGSPLGPAVGVVDAMRIGADVTPYWSKAIDRLGGRGRHGLATRNAVVNIVTRSVFDGVWWLNDPDCLMVRDADTRLSLEEVRTLATVVGMTDGMVVISDRLDDLGDERRDVVRLTSQLSGGVCTVADLFDRAVPETLVSRHRGHVDIAALNLGEQPRRAVVDLRRLGIDAPRCTLQEWWTGEPVSVAGAAADLGELPPHSSRLIRIDLVDD